MRLVAAWEWHPNADYFTQASGYADAIAAHRQAKGIGQLPGSAIYFAVDFNAQDATSEEPSTGISAAAAGRGQPLKGRRSTASVSAGRRLRLPEAGAPSGIRLAVEFNGVERLRQLYQLEHQTGQAIAVVVVQPRFERSERRVRRLSGRRGIQLPVIAGYPLWPTTTPTFLPASCAANCRATRCTRTTCPRLSRHQPAGAGAHRRNPERQYVSIDDFREGVRG